MKKYIVKIFIFIFFLFCGVQFCNELFRDKVLTIGGRESVTVWVDEYRQLPPNTVDVLFIGSSQSFCTANPNGLWNDYGIASYTLGSSAQDIYATKSFLTEAFKFQSPKLIFFEVRTMLSNNSEERWNRLAYDNLSDTLAKYKNLSESISVDEETDESMISYLAPVLRYHDRWKELNHNDFSYALGRYKPEYSLLGFYPRYNQTVVSDWGQALHNNVGNYELSERSKQAVSAMKKLCDKKDALLILWKAPSPMWRDAYHNSIKQFSNSIGVPFLDLNYENLNLDPKTDFFDENSHLNYYGSEKATAYLGEYISSNYYLPNRRNDDDYEYWDLNYRQMQKITLQHTNDLSKYISLLTSEKYTIFMAVNDGMASVSDELQQAFKTLGLQSDFSNAGTKSFIGVIHNGQTILEDFQDNPIHYNLQFGKITVELMSKGYHVGDDGAIWINGINYMLEKQRGLGIVVYDNELGEVVDSVTWDIKENAKAYRHDNLNL